VFLSSLIGGIVEDRHEARSRTCRSCYKVARARVAHARDARSRAREVFSSDNVSTGARSARESGDDETPRDDEETTRSRAAARARAATRFLFRIYKSVDSDTRGRLARKKNSTHRTIRLCARSLSSLLERGDTTCSIRAFTLSLLEKKRETALARHAATSTTRDGDTRRRCARRGAHSCPLFLQEGKKRFGRRRTGEDGTRTNESDERDLVDLARRVEMRGCAHTPSRHPGRHLLREKADFSSDSMRFSVHSSLSAHSAPTSHSGSLCRGALLMRARARARETRALLRVI
jgi:hypothetical protein